MSIALNDGEVEADPLQRLIRLTGVRPDQAVAVAGPGSLDVMCALIQAGFSQVECARQATCAVADGSCDLLILCGPVDELGSLARRTARLLRNGAVLAAAVRKVGDDAALRHILTAQGLEVAGSTLDMAFGLTVIHRVTRRGDQDLARAG